MSIGSSILNPPQPPKTSYVIPSSTRLDFIWYKISRVSRREPRMRIRFCPFGHENRTAYDNWIRVSRSCQTKQELTWKYCPVRYRFLQVIVGLSRSKPNLGTFLPLVRKLFLVSFCQPKRDTEKLQFFPCNHLKYKGIKFSNFSRFQWCYWHYICFADL